MSTAIANKPAAAPAVVQALDAAIMEQLVIGGDLGKLNAEQRMQYYAWRCERIGVDPASQPFQYIVLNNKLTLYAQKSCTDQLTAIHKLSRSVTAREQIADVYVVTARVTHPEGRYDESTGAVATVDLKGEALANAMMKAETKAKRRATLSLMGLGMLDESEVDSIPGAQAVQPDKTNGDAKAVTQAVETNGSSANPPLTADEKMSIVLREHLMEIVQRAQRLALPAKDLQTLVRTHNKRGVFDYRKLNLDEAQALLYNLGQQLASRNRPETYDPDAPEDNGEAPY